MKNRWTIQNHLISESILGAIILIVFFIYNAISGHYAITLFMAIAGACFLVSTVIVCLCNRNRLSRKNVIQLIALPVCILALYALVGAVSGSLV